MSSFYYAVQASSRGAAAVRLGSTMALKISHCSACRIIRTLLLAVVLGGGAGYWVLDTGGSADLSMAATFLGAIAPILWHVRKDRIRKQRSL
jgi:hypothetical protein